MHSDTLVVAIGGAGRAIAKAVMYYLDADFLLINADRYAQPANGDGCISLTTNAGDGHFHSPRHARKAALLAEEEISRMLASYDRIVLAVGLGGATGSGAAPVVADAAVRLGKHLFSAVTLPFGFEGERVTIAQTALDSLRGSCGAVIIHDHQRALSSLGAYSLEDAFQLVADRLGRSVAEKIAA